MVSVIIPVYNCEEYLPECLDSLIAQSYTDLEIICVNDGSTDHSLDILNEYQKIQTLFMWTGIDNRALLYGLDHIQQVCARISELK